ncbi:hypothetical protein IGI04_001318 [Brassica rapa subsp. trilocularis]|uniref:TIR domain-containing protein n=1 Tax=Brassica rapa subsp. trilocularis TaxID=1813537 RepID=A0ABQ7NUD8_BRACM|nr:hypothetical protein IGI04_001318 [Brassica rapa subsp. trilocularis]
MTNVSPYWKRDQVFITFRGQTHREGLVSFLTEKLGTSGINYYVDYHETRGYPITIVFRRIRESGVALIFFSAKYPESCWCLDELVEIKKQMEIGSIIPFPVFYKVRAESVKKQTGWFGINTLLRTEDLVRKKVDRGSNKSILETEAIIWEWRQALVSVGGRMGFPYRHSSDEVFLSELVVKVKELIDKISSPRNIQTVIERPLMHPQEAVMSLLQALNLSISDLKDLITKPFIHISGLGSLSTDHLLFLDLNSLKNPGLAQTLFNTGQAGKVLLVLLGFLEYYNESFAFAPLLFPKNPQKFTGNKLICSSKEIQDQSHSLPVEVTNGSNVVAIVESNDDNLQNHPGQDINSDDTLTCFSLLCNIMKWLAMILSPPYRGVSISFGEKQLEQNLVSLLRTIEDQVRKKVNRENEKSILDTEAKIWGWRQALLSIASRPGLSYQHSNDLAFVSDIVAKVKKLFAYRERKPSPTSSSITTDLLVVEETPMQRQETAAITTVQYNDNDLFYSPSSFLQALNLEVTDLECFKQIPNGLASLSLKGHANLVFFSLSSPDDLVKFQSSDSFQFLQKGLAMTPSGVSRVEEPSRVLALEPNQSQQWFDNRLIAPEQDHHSNHFPAQINSKQQALVIGNVTRHNSPRLLLWQKLTRLSGVTPLVYPRRPYMHFQTLIRIRDTYPNKLK